MKINTNRSLLAECLKGENPINTASIPQRVLVCNVILSKVIHAMIEGNQTTQTAPLYTNKGSELSSYPLLLL